MTAERGGEALNRRIGFENVHQVGELFQHLIMSIGDGIQMLVEQRIQLPDSLHILLVDSYQTFRYPRLFIKHDLFGMNRSLMASLYHLPKSQREGEEARSIRKL